MRFKFLACVGGGPLIVARNVLRVDAREEKRDSHVIDLRKAQKLEWPRQLSRERLRYLYTYIVCMTCEDNHACNTATNFGRITYHTMRSTSPNEWNLVALYIIKARRERGVGIMYLTWRGNRNDERKITRTFLQFYVPHLANIRFSRFIFASYKSL